MKKYLALFFILLIASCKLFSDQETVGTFPIYGNYCGLDHPKKDTTPPAIDQVDLACKSHDNCYEASGYFNKRCDEDLLDRLSRISPETPQEAIAKELISEYFNKISKI